MTIFSIIISSALVVILMLFLTLSIRDVNAPVLLKKYIYKQIESLNLKDQFDFARLQISLGENFKPNIIVSEVTIYDSENRKPFLEISKVELGLSIKQLYSGKFDLTTISLDGLSLGIKRDIKGDFSVKFGPSSSLTADSDNALFLLSATLKNFLDKDVFLNLENFMVTSMTVQYDDQKASSLWVVDGARIELKKQINDISVRGDAAFLMGGADVSTLQINYETNLSSGKGSLGILFDDFPAEEIAAQSPALSWLNIVEAPISGAFRTEIGSDMEVNEISASLKIGSGVLRADAKSRPLNFDNANVYFSYDRKINLLNFEEININSKDLKTSLAGSIQLKIDNDDKFLYTGKLRSKELEINPLELYENPLEFEDVEVDFILEPEPFNLEVQQLSVKDPSRDLVIVATGQIVSGQSGWEVSSQLESDKAKNDDIIAYWPPDFKKNGRLWLEKNVLDANLRDLYASVTFGSSVRPKVVMGYSFSNATINLLDGFSPLEEASGSYSFYDKRFSVSLSSGYVGGQDNRLDLSGSNLVVNNTDIKPYPGKINLHSAGSLSALISMSDLEKNYGFEKPKKLQGSASLQGILELPLKMKIEPNEIKYKLSGFIKDLKISGETFLGNITSDELSLEIKKSHVQLSGQVSVGDIPADIKYISGFGKEGNTITPRIEGKILISENIFNILQYDTGNDWLSGSAAAFVFVDFPRNQNPTFRLTSNLQGLEIRLPEIGWKKNQSELASLEVFGNVNDGLEYDKFIISGEDLEVIGTVSDDEAFILERLFRDGILDVSGLVSKDGLKITGGEFNLANYLKIIELNSEKNEGIPITVDLDTIYITDSFYIDNFSTNFFSDRINGHFYGLFMGVDPISGSYTSNSGISTVEILSNDAGTFLQEAGLIKKGAEGSLKLSINRNQKNIEGRLLTEDLKIYDLPALAKLLQALSIIGLLEQMLGQGLFLDESDINFRLDEGQYIIDRASFFGPSLGISLDGYFDRKGKLLDFQGVFSPVYAINSIGSVLTRKGEGLIGINFDLWGNPDTPKVLVNPFSVLTPGMFREIFRRPPPKVELE